MSAARIPERGPLPTSRTALWVKLSLSLGFLALAVGILRAAGEPVTSYEVSVYRGTPVSFWMGVGTALLVSISVTAFGFYRVHTGLTLGLGATGVLAVVFLPLVRGFYFNGQADAMTHLGWVREVSGSVMQPYELIYPNAHVFGSAVASVLGINARHAMLLAVPVFVAAYLVFVTLTVRALVPETGATVTAAFVAFLLLPVFNVAGSLMFIPFSLATFVAPVFLFLLVLYVDRRAHRIVSGFPVTDLDVVLFLTGGSLLLFHPQLFSDLLLLLGVITGLQLLYRFADWESRITHHRWVGGQFLALGALFVAWNANHSAAGRTFEQVVSALTGSAPAGEIVRQRGASLTDIGASLPELFVKLFLVRTVLTLFVAWFVLRSLRRQFDYDYTNVDAWSRYLLFGGVVLTVYATVHFFGRVSSYFFRHVTFGMALVSIFGAIGLYLAVRSSSLLDRSPRSGVSGVRTMSVVVIVVAVALSVAVFFPSPYIYSGSHQVTESSYEGYETAFAHRADGVQFTGVRGGAKRYSEAMVDVPTIESVALYGEAIRDGLPTAVETDSYFAVTEQDRQRETLAYRELRVTRSDFERIDNQLGVSRVQTNDDFQLYYVSTDASS